MTLYQQYVNQVITSLKADGERIIRECEREKTYKHDTKNLYDSYGYGVYVGGAIQARGYLSQSPEANRRKEWGGEEIAGREEIDHFLDSYGATQGVELVIVAAMPYAAILESGAGLSKKYKVIAMSYEKLSAIKGKYNGKVYNIANGRRQ